MAFYSHVHEALAPEDFTGRPRNVLSSHPGQSTALHTGGSPEQIQFLRGGLPQCMGISSTGSYAFGKDHPLANGSLRFFLLLTIRC